MVLPWYDRHGRFQPLKAVVLVLCVTPGLLYGGWWIGGALSGRALNDVIHATGLWAVRFFLATLAITFIAQGMDWSRLLIVRRMVGLTALAYAVVHLLLYMIEQKFALLFIAGEIVTRFYLTIGFVALMGLAALGVTSTDNAVRRLGRWWKRLHRLAYPIGVLALWHYFLQNKANVSEAVFAAGLFVWLIAWRLLPRSWRRHGWVYPGLAIVAGIATAFIEFTWYALATGINPWRVLAANETIDFGLRPAHWVVIVGFGIAVAILLRRGLAAVRPPRMSGGGSSVPLRARAARGS